MSPMILKGLPRSAKNFSKLNVMEQSPKIKFQKDGAALHFLPKFLINLGKQMNIFLAGYKFFNSLVICYSVLSQAINLQPEHISI